MGRLTLKVLTPAAEVVAREVDSVNLTATGGEVGILPGHAPLLAELRPGAARYVDGSAKGALAHSDGFLEVSGDTVLVLVQAAESAGEIDIERAKARLAESQTRAADGSLSGDERAAAERSVAKQQARIAVSG
ncbi:MAG: ATP synthase F1 subunit epsilon [Acidobacteriota bacterium]